MENVTGKNEVLLKCISAAVCLFHRITDDEEEHEKKSKSMTI